ncbi:MAG: KUP/HAK/KT family potassium transporter [Ginsengibacter sp.]
MASQAIITGSYKLVNEAMNLNFWPRITTLKKKSLNLFFLKSLNEPMYIGFSISTERKSLTRFRIMFQS